MGFRIKRGDRLPVLPVICLDADGNAVDLSTATSVRFHMRPVGSSTVKVNTAATPDPDQVTNKGKVTYAWGAADTDTAGPFWGEIEAVFPGTLPMTFPNGEHIPIDVYEDLA